MSEETGAPEASESSNFLGGESAAVESSPMDFVPESYRNEPWVDKYKEPEQFWAGMKHQQALIGKKQIVQGLEVPGEESADNEWNEFYKNSGRPDDAAGYEFANNHDADGEEFTEFSDTFGNLAHKHGLSKKQAEGLLDDYMLSEKDSYDSRSLETEKDINTTIGELWGDNAEQQLGMAKKGAMLLNLGDKLDTEGLSTNPLVLQLCAELGKRSSEAVIKGQGEAPESKEMLMEKATRMQKDPNYWTDETLQRQVGDIFKKVYGNAPVGAAVSEGDFINR